VLGRYWGTRIGPLPAPEAQDEQRDPAVPLTRAADLIAAADRVAPRPVPLVAHPLLALLGAGCAIAVALPAKGLLAAFGGSLVVAILAQLMIFIAPFVGLPVARAWVRRRWRTRLEFGGFVLTALGGMLACCSIVALL
jgi:NADH:ubiquinone oxidoreductase subunit 2 (subunit N)